MSFNASWKAAKNGFPSDREAINYADQINQFLVSHEAVAVYPGTQIVAANPTGNGFHLFQTGAPPNQADHSQAFTMPVGETTVGRVVIPLTYSGKGGDLQVSLCPDSSGSPDLDNAISTTVVPKSWITNLGNQGSLTTDVPQLVTTQYNNIALDNTFVFSWAQPAIGPNGAATAATPFTSGNYLILLGGYDLATSSASSVVATVPTLGQGVLGNPILQPSLPQAAWYGMAAATDSSVWYAGGTDGTNFFSNVWSASWDVNTGTIGAWTAQASLPVPVIQGAATSWGDYVYFAGGSSNLSAANAYSTIYYAQANNGQVQTWNTATELPQPLQLIGFHAINGWMIACGGQTSSGATSNKTYYAKISSTDGSLGAWMEGPDMPVGVFANSAQWTFARTESAMISYSGLTANSPSLTYTMQMQVIPVMADSGIGEWWSQVTNSAGVSGSYQVASFPHGEPGVWQLNVLQDTQYFGTLLRTASRVSVPLPATGLTPGNVYHVVIHNMNQSLTDYVRLYVALDDGLDTYKFRAPYTNGTWTTEPTPYSIIIDVYNNNPGGDPVWHVWQDPDANRLNRSMASSTLVWGNYGRLLGYCDGVIIGQDPLNINTLTENNTTNWTATGCTLTASTAQTHGGYAYSGLVTPDGVTATIYIESELMSVEANGGYQASSWVYSTNGYTISLTINWYDSTQTFISASTNDVAVSSATWTYLTNNATAPEGAAYATIVPTESGTPAASDTFYLSYITLTAFDPTVSASVAQIDYGTEPWPPTGVTQLN